MNVYFENSTYKIASESGKYSGSITYDHTGKASDIRLYIKQGSEEHIFDSIESLQGKIDLLNNLKELVEKNGKQQRTVSKN